MMQDLSCSIVRFFLDLLHLSLTLSVLSLSSQVSELASSMQNMPCRPRDERHICTQSAQESSVTLTVLMKSLECTLGIRS